MDAESILGNAFQAFADKLGVPVDQVCVFY